LFEQQAQNGHFLFCGPIKILVMNIL